MRNYKADKQGFKNLGKSSAMGQAMVRHARMIAGAAEASGQSTYGAAPYTVISGRDNEARAGAIVHEAEPHYDDRRDSVLRATAIAMGRRG